MELRRFFRSKADGTNFLRTDGTNTVCAYTHLVDNATSEWVVNHNNNSIIIAVQIFVGGEVVQPDEIIIDNGNTFRILFSTPVSGAVHFMVLGLGDDCGEITG